MDTRQRRQNLNNLYQELTHWGFGGKAPDFVVCARQGASPSGLNGRRNNLGVVADVFRRTQTDAVFRFSEGKVSRTEGRVVAAAMTRRHGRRNAAPTERKPKTADVVGALAHTNHPQIISSAAAVRPLFRWFSDYPPHWGWGLRGSEQ